MMTNPSIESVKPDKPDKADRITNHEFLKAVYGDLPDYVRGMIVSSKGNPNHSQKAGFWKAKAWRNSVTIRDDYNNYFTVSAFNPDENDQYKRQKKYFSAMYAIVLDDIGTKILIDLVDLEPSWKIETSSGNYQYGYILKDPITDLKTADNLVSAIIAAGLCDPGSSGPCARLARLPVGINGKHNPAFMCRLTSWKPELRYNFDDLAKGLSLNLETREKKAGKSDKTDKAPYPEQIYTPCPDENPVLAELKSRGLYKREIDTGKHDVTCPWVDEHTDAVDGGTAYFEPGEYNPFGGFKCHHGHCAGRNIHTLLEHLDISASFAGMRPVIRVVSGELHNTVNFAERELAKTGNHYQYGGLIVTIAEDKTTQEIVIKEMKPAALDAALARCAIWEGYDGRGKKIVKKDVPPRVISALAAAEYKHLPLLRGLAHQPYLFNGNVINKSGYNPETGMYGAYDERDFNISDFPSKADAGTGLELLSGLLKEFPFANEHDRSAALSALLTASIRSSLNLAPMYHVRAPEISSGKSFLCEITASIASSAVATPAPFPQNDEECRKHLFSSLKKCPAVIIFDNLTSDIPAHNSFCTILTSPFLSDRILGVSQMASVSTRTLFLSNGNNVGPIQDMTRRCNVINLDPACEMPASRTFKNPNLLSDLRHNRALYVSAALTIIQAWINAGCPKTDCKPIASYTEWSDLCRQPLLWLGLPDPAINMFNTMSDDPEREFLGRILRVWRNLYGNAPMKVSAFVTTVITGCDDFETDDIKDILMEIAGDRNGINNTRFGRWVKRNEGKIVNGFRFNRATVNTNTALWRVEEVK
jgi:hypothetical protein